MSLPQRYVSQGGKVIEILEPKFSAKTKRLDQEKYPSLFPSVDFTRSDALRSRPLHVEGKVFYVDDYYLSVWSPYFRSRIAAEAASGNHADLVIHEQRADNFLQFLEAIYPQQAPITAQNIEVILPLAFDYQVDGLLKRCTEYLMQARIAFMDKILIADRFGLEDLITWCLAGSPTTTHVHIGSPQYGLLSDRTKVRLLESVQGATTSTGSITPRHLSLRGVDASTFATRSDLFFGTVRSKSGRTFHCNPYYLAAWSAAFYEVVVAMNTTDLVCNASDEELKHFLVAIHPPMADITDSNVAWILRAACKLEAVGMIRLCAEHLLFAAEEIKPFDKLSLFDRCYLHELVEPCLWDVLDLDALLQLTKHQAFASLSARAKASILDWVAQLVRAKPKLPPTAGLGHVCKRCKIEVKCSEVRQWVCPHCTYQAGITRSNERKQ